MNRPHIVFRKRTERCLPEYWTGHDWDRDSTKANAMTFEAAVNTLIFHRKDKSQRDFSFGVMPDGQGVQTQQ